MMVVLSLSIHSPDTEVDAEFGDMMKTLSRHTGLIAKLIQKRSSEKSEVIRTLVQNTEASPHRIPQPFHQHNHVDYDEQMRRHEQNDMEETKTEDVVVTDMERNSFFARMGSLNPNISTCLVITAFQFYCRHDRRTAITCWSRCSVRKRRVRMHVGVETGIYGSQSEDAQSDSGGCATARGSESASSILHSPPRVDAVATATCSTRRDAEIFKANWWSDHILNE